MQNLYIHIPFCLKKCGYCDFVSRGGCEMHLMEAYVDRLIVQITHLPQSTFETVFFGGGTPTALGVKQLGRVVSAIESHHTFQEEYEMTVEANPETVTPSFARAMVDMGINRVSMGLQSADDKVLCAIGRIHTYDRFKGAFEDLRNAGIGNINIDLMYGLPVQTPKIFHDTIRTVMSLDPEHISAYELNLSGDSPMDKQIRLGELHLPIEDEIVAMTDWLKILEPSFPRYEISNYAKPGFECRHNLNYWHNGSYFGVGCGAHGCLDSQIASEMCHTACAIRTENTSDIEEYIKGAAQRYTFIEKKEAMFETVMVGLRLVCGVHEYNFKRKYGVELFSIIGDYIQKYPNLIIRESGHIRLTPRGMDIQNTVLSKIMDLFF